MVKPRSYRTSLEYVAAMVLPGLAVYLSAHWQILHPIPLALSYVLIAFIAKSSAPGPSVLAAVCTSAWFKFWIAPPERAWTFTGLPLLQTCITLVLGLVIAYLFQQQRHTEMSWRTAHRELREITDALIQAQRGSNSAAWSYDSITNRTSWYEGGAELFGRSLAELTEMGSPLQLLFKDDVPVIEAARKHTLQTREPFHVEFRAVWPNGEIRWLESHGVPQPSNPSIWLGITTDITNRKTAELALIRSEKLAAAGRLAASIAHEINNPLESLTNLIYLARSAADSSDTQLYLQDADRELRRIAKITNQTLRFHRQQSRPAEMNIMDEITSLLDFYESRFMAAGINVKVEAEAVPSLTCHANDMQQAFGNLLLNALEAMRNGGSLRVRVRLRTDWNRCSPVLRITVADSGTGMSDATKARIYEPFFTTKDHTNTGLGLWVAAGVVDRYGGSIRVRSRARPDSHGSVFSVTLPLSHPNVTGERPVPQMH